ncbi:hypothetical protein BC830DRAFT_941783 [Chytriomyces sp. MP71]|nr:hypothetical protein BC830DRAFT_941783 [Chytriomyces sp. MP71]
MCGRQALAASEDAIAASAGVRPEQWTGLAVCGSSTGRGATGSKYRKSYNNGPMRSMPCLVSSKSNPGHHESRSLTPMRWGISTYPSNAARPTLTINARSDTLAANQFALWNSLKQTQRCLVPVQGWFEWFDKDQTPHFIAQPQFHPTTAPDTGIMWLAAIYQTPEQVADEHPGALPRFVIVTVPSEGSCVAWLHDRMPVILDSEKDQDTWLDPTVPFGRVLKLLKPYSGKLQCYPVDPAVNKIKNDDIGLVTRKEERKGTLLQFFGKKEAFSTDQVSPSPEITSSSSSGTAEKM